MALGNKYLTDDGSAPHAATTFPGQAHWGDPTIGRTCRECLFWAPSGVGEPKRDTWGVLVPRRCRKASQLSHLRALAPVPHDAVACRYFDENPEPPKEGR